MFAIGKGNLPVVLANPPSPILIHKFSVIKKINCSDCPVEACLVKKNFVPAWQTICFSGKRMENFRPDFPVYAAGNSVEGLYFVHSGLVREYVQVAESREFVVRFAGPGKILGSIAMAKETYRNSASAQEESVVCFFDNKAIYEMYLSNPHIAFDLMHYFSDLFNRVTHRLKSIALMNLREKVAEAILYVAAQFGVTEKNELVYRISREDMAGLVCTTMQQISRQLSEFEEEKLIERKGRAIILLNRDKLEEIVAKY
jgi:CRP-like cAMP-binding protein